MHFTVVPWSKPPQGQQWQENYPEWHTGRSLRRTQTQEGRAHPPLTSYPCFRTYKINHNTELIEGPCLH
uniref:Uncharacterized protein n=1 Tax=Anguilla anguilla TaxID=7936 RepID=A0A0E9X4W5_ANGAN